MDHTPFHCVIQCKGPCIGLTFISPFVTFVQSHFFYFYRVSNCRYRTFYLGAELVELGKAVFSQSEMELLLIGPTFLYYDKDVILQRFSI
jgi:hypothetical protein